MSSENLSQKLPANIAWHHGQVDIDVRSHLLKQKPLTIWFTGLSASGKSTLAYTVERLLIDSGQLAYVLDGDNIRHGLNNNLKFSPEDRSENIRRVAEVAKIMNDAGLIVLTSFISPYRIDRLLARQIIGHDRFFEVHVSTDLTVCEQRDPKGLYQKARSGLLPEFTGISAPYEQPENPEYRIDTTLNQPIDCANSVLNAFSNRIRLSSIVTDQEAYNAL